MPFVNCDGFALGTNYIDTLQKKGVKTKLRSLQDEQPTNACKRFGSYFIHFYDNTLSRQIDKIWNFKLTTSITNFQ